MDQGSSSLNPASLIDLKAELQKKYDSFKKEKLTSNLDRPKQSTFKCKGKEVNKKVEKKTEVTKNIIVDPEEEEALKKSKLALEAKSRLYENIVVNKILIDDEQNESYLVDFQRKVLYDPVNYSLKSKKESSPVLQPKGNDKASFEISKETSDNSILHRKKPEPPIQINNPDQPIHYQNVQFNEVRDHGTGYFAFSMDDAKRKEQMDELNFLRKDTEDQIALKKRLVKKRKTMIQNRLAKICERKNIDISALKAFEDTEEKEEKSIDELPKFPTVDADANADPPTKIPKIRPWDIGKDQLQQFVPERKKTCDNTDWIKEKREERHSEFAPPSNYK